MKRRVQVLLLSSFMGGMVQALAANNSNLAFFGMLIEPPPCSINSGNRIDVNFGDRIGVGKVDGVNYRQTVNYQVTCEGSKDNGWSLILSLSGEKSDFDANALLTSRENLGIRLYQNGKPFMPGSAIAIDKANPPVLEAVPVKNQGAKLTEGAFEAWATLHANYL